MAVRQGCSLSRVFDASSFGPNLSNWGDRALVEIMTCTTEGLTPTLRAAFGQNAMTPTPVWTDITDDVLEGNTRRGAQFEVDRMEPGGADLTLTNGHGDYWPGNAEGSHYPNVRPSTRFNIRATYRGKTYHLFTGFATDWRNGYLGVGGAVPVARVTLVDALRFLRGFNLNVDPGYPREKSGTRVENVLDDMGWPAGDRELDPGVSEVQASGALEHKGALEHCDDVLKSERGKLFVSGCGVIRYDDRHARYKSPLNLSQATFGDGPGELGYHDVEFEFSDQLIKNDIRAQRVGGTEETASDAASQSTHGKRSKSTSGLLNTDDNEVQDQVYYDIARLKDPHSRVKSITLRPRRDQAMLLSQVLGRELADRITLRLDDASVDGAFHIEGIRHLFRAGFWETQWWVSDGEAESAWVLGVAGFTELGSTTRLSY